MEHQQIIDTLSDLLPDIKKSASADDVLLKHAQDQNLAPAQLERMAQIFNIAKTINFMDKSANRGGSFKVVDTNQLMENYTSYDPPAKEAVSNEWSAWFEDPIEKAASASPDPDNINAWIDSPKSAMVKEAIKKQEDDGWHVYSHDGAKHLGGPYKTEEGANKRLQQVHYFKHKKAADSLPDILGLARGGATSVAIGSDTFADGGSNELAYPLRTVGRLIEEMGKEALEKFEVESIGQIIDDQKEKFRKVASQLMEKLQTGQASFDEMEHDATYHMPEGHGKEAADALDNYFQQSGWTFARLAEDHAKPKLVRDRHDAVELFKAAHESLDLIKGAEAYKEHYKQAAVATDTDKDVRNPESESDSKKKRRKDDVTFNIKDPYDREKKKEDSKGSVGSGDGVKAFNKVTEGIGNTAFSGMKSMVDKVRPTSNKKQEKIDTAGKDVERVTTLQKLMLTDPIIAEADPETVVSLYNTLASSNEELARDPNLLKFALREALQYDAVPLHTYKDLVEMGKSRAQSDEGREKLRDKKYKI